MSGWIKLHRAIKDSFVYGNPNAVALWVELLLSANHQPWSGWFAGQKVDLEKGQLITSRKSLSERTGVNEGTVQRLLTKLTETKQIEQQNKGKFRIITISNYSKYQDSEQQMHNRCTADEQQMNTIEELKRKIEELKEEKPLSGKPDRAAKFDVQSIFDFWKETLNHPKAILDVKRKAVILNAFKIGFTEDQLKAAIVGCSLTPHNMGKNDRNTVFDELRVIFKDAGQIERFIGNSTNPPKNGNSVGIGKGNDCDYDRVNYQTGTTPDEALPSWVKGEKK